MTSSQSENFQNTQVKHLKEMKGYAYVSDGKALVYSGYTNGNWERAAEYAKKHNMNPIETTRPGKILESVVNARQKALSRSNKREIWNSASRSYAAQVRGNVQTFVAGADTNGIFRQTELSTLLNNKKVETINGMDRVKIDQARRQTFNRLRQQGMDRRQAALRANGAAHRKVATQEIRQDLQKSQQQKDQALRADSLKRLEALRTQNKKEVKQSQQLKAAQERQEKINQNKAVQKYGADRYEKIEKQNFEKLQSQGLKATHARKTAQDRVKHVKEKLVLNAERQELQQKGQQLKAKEAQAYQQKLTDFKNRRIEDLKAQSQNQGTAYKGPPQKDPSLSHKADKANAQAFEQKTHLKAAFNEGSFKENEYQKRMDNIDKSRERMIDRSVSQDISQQQNQSQSQNLDQGPSHGISH